MKRYIHCKRLCLNFSLSKFRVFERGESERERERISDNINTTVYSYLYSSRDEHDYKGVGLRMGCLSIYKYVCVSIDSYTSDKRTF